MKKISLLIIIFTTVVSQAQTYKFGKVSKAELNEKVCAIDSNANAAILYSKQITEFDFSQDEGFFIRTKYFVRIKIYDKAAADWATKKIYLHQQNNTKEKASSVKAVTYNLENNKIVKTNLSKKNIFIEKTSKYLKIKKFTFPNIKNGSVLEYKYTVESPFFSNFRRVAIQRTIPVKKFYARIAIPEYFVYKTHTIGYLPIKITEDQQTRDLKVIYRSAGSPGSASSLGSGSLNFQEHTKTIAQENIPALKVESFAGNIKNYAAAVAFELNYIDFPRKTRKLYSTDWESISRKIFQSDRFGAQLKKTSHFKDELLAVIAGSSSEINKMMRVLAFAKKKIKWNKHKNYYCEKGIRKAYKEGFGNVADINLNLIAMLRTAGFKANPVLVSTINHGVPIAPTRDGFNYVIALVETSNDSYLLDATHPYSIPNVLDESCYNFQGRLIKEDGKSSWINLYPQQYSSVKRSLRAKFTGTGFEGGFRTAYTNNFLYDYRKKMAKKSIPKQQEIVAEKHPNIEINKFKALNLNDLTKNVVTSVQFSTDAYFEKIANKIYISPLLFFQRRHNPFKADKRLYPVFYNKPWLKSNTIYINIPATYEIVSIPESITLTLPNDLGSFSYQLTQQGQTIVIKATTVINTPIILPTAYPELKKLYTDMINKQQEKIVIQQKL